MKDWHIRVDSIHIYRPYAGALEGWPSPEECIHEAKERAGELFNSLPLVVIEPKQTVHRAMPGNPQPPTIPRWCHIAHLSGDAKDPKENHGAHLVAIWFEPEHSTDISGIVPKLDWAKNAEDWQF